MSIIHRLMNAGIIGDDSIKATKQLNTLQLDTDFKFGLIKALNGTIIEISTFKSNPNGPDWTHEAYIVKDGETPADAMATLMIMKGLAK